MEDHRKKMNEDFEKDVIFSHSIKAGKRIYYLDVRKTRKDEMYLSITESKKVIGGEGAEQQVSYEKHKIFLYREDFGNFIDGLSKVIRFVQEAEKAGAPAADASDQAPVSETDAKPAEEGPVDDLKIEF